MYYFAPNSDFIDFIYYKDGRTEIKYIKDVKECARLQKVVNFAIGTSWALVIEGEKNTLNKERIQHSRTRQPRTLLGQKKDGRFILIVVEGRGKNMSIGITAKQSSQLMYDLRSYNAVNLDGGGSSVMKYNNRIVNSPTDGVQRRIGSAILILKK